jgi:hypothetical protein
MPAMSNKIGRMANPDRAWLLGLARGSPAKSEWLAALPQ